MFRRIVFWFGGMLLFSFVAYYATARWFGPGASIRDDMFRRLFRFEASEAEYAYESGGAAALGQCLARIGSEFPARHHLLSLQGRDLADGTDRADLLKENEGLRLPWGGPHRLLIRRATPDGRYIFLAEGELPPGNPWQNLGVYGWIVLVIILLCYVLAWRLARPIRALRENVVRFGEGDLTSRTNSQRRDEAGELARAFDQMADRIGTLLTAERRLLQDISHELRSPLTRLRFAVELGRSGNDSGAAFDRITKEVDRLATLIDELLQITRAEGDPESRNLDSIDLPEFLSSLVESCRIEAEARGCKLALKVDGPMQWSGDRELLHRAVENVLRNAIRHTDADTAVQVELSRETDCVVIRVCDHGAGVPEPDLARIFQPFYRVNEDRSRKDGGVGLGLAIASRAVQVHHGRIEAQNMHPGLMVELKLPFVEE